MRNSPRFAGPDRGSHRRGASTIEYLVLLPLLFVTLFALGSWESWTSSYLFPFAASLTALIALRLGSDVVRSR